MSKRYANTYESPRSIKLMAGILDMMRKADYITPQEVADTMKISNASVGNYLRAMADRGLVVCIQRNFVAAGVQGGSIPSRWKIAEDGDEHAPRRECVDVRRVVVSTRWEARKVPPMFEPMAYLYGMVA